MFAFSMKADEILYAVTYEFSGGRFGDNLLSYLHAKWISYIYEIQLFYKPFPFSSDLQLHDREICLDNKQIRHFQRRSIFNFQENLKDASPTLFICPYFPEDPSFQRLNPKGHRFDVNWKDPEFKKIAQEMIAPKGELLLTIPPKTTVNIAIHIREGGGYDTDHTRLWDPLKLPPLHFYIQGLLEVLEQFHDRPIYCYLFTDAIEPHLLAEELQQAIPKQIPIQIDYRRTQNRHDANVLEDFFSFFHFDVLIHPQSNYSIVAEKIGDFAIIYTPTNFQRQGKKIEITESKFEINETKYQNVLKRTRDGSLHF